MWRVLIGGGDSMKGKSWDSFDRMSTPGWLRRRCQVDANAITTKGATTCDEGVGCESQHIV
jgi:hypothetical protein